MTYGGPTSADLDQVRKTASTINAVGITILAVLVVAYVAARGLAGSWMVVGLALVVGIPALRWFAGVVAAATVSAQVTSRPPATPVAGSGSPATENAGTAEIPRHAEALQRSDANRTGTEVTVLNSDAPVDFPLVPVDIDNRAVAPLEPVLASDNSPVLLRAVAWFATDSDPHSKHYSRDCSVHLFYDRLYVGSVTGDVYYLAFRIRNAERFLKDAIHASVVFDASRRDDDSHELLGVSVYWDNNDRERNRDRRFPSISATNRPA